MAGIKRKKDIYEEETGMFVSILLELNRPFKFSERRGTGTTEDPFYRTVEYFASDTDMKKISEYIKKLRKIQKEFLIHSIEPLNTWQRMKILR